MLAIPIASRLSQILYLRKIVRLRNIYEAPTRNLASFQTRT